MVHYLILRLLLAGMAYAVLLWILRLNLPYTAVAQTTIRILILAIFPEAIFTLLQAIFIAHERLFVPTLAAFVNSLIKIIAGIWLLWQGTTVIALAWVIVAGSSLSLLTFVPSILHLFREIPQISGRINLRFAWQQLKTTPGFIVIGLFTTLDYQLDTLLISIFLNETELGWYGAAQTIMLIFWMMPNALRAALYPLMARYYYESPERLALLYQRTNRYILVIILPICAGIALLSRPLTRLIFGDAFDPSAIALQWMIWAVIFLFLNVPNARMMLVAHRQQQAGWITALSMVTNLGFNLWLIPLFGIIGAAMARTLASFVFFVVMYLYVQRYLLQEGIGHLIGRPLFATMVMGTAVYLLRHTFILWPILAGILIYTIIIISLKTIPEQDRQLLHQFHL